MIQKLSRESILNYYIYNKTSIIEQIMNIKITKNEMEKNIGDLKKVRKTDIYFTTDFECKILGEVQIGTSDTIHLEQILKNINSINNEEFAVVFWVASFFCKKDIERIKTEVKGKNIMFYALKLNNDVNAILERLSNLEYNKIAENIEVLDDINNLLTINSCFISNNYKRKDYSKEPDLSNREIQLNYVYKNIKQELQEYYKINYGKSTLSRGYVSFGIGQEDIALRVSIDNNDIENIDLVFNGKKKEVFDNLLIQKDKIISELGFYIRFDLKYKKISIKKKINKDIEIEDLNYIVDTFCRMYRYFRKILK